MTAHFDFRAAAQELIEANPLFVAFDIDEQQDIITEILKACGAPANELNIGVMLKYVTDPEYRARWAPAKESKPVAKAAKKARGGASRSKSILEPFHKATGFSDAEIGAKLGMTRLAAHLRRHGKVADNLTIDQCRTLKQILEDRALLIADTLDELDRLGA